MTDQIATTIVPTADGRIAVKRAVPEPTREERLAALWAAARAHPSPSRRMSVEEVLALFDRPDPAGCRADRETAARIRARLAGLRAVPADTSVPEWPTIDRLE